VGQVEDYLHGQVWPALVRGHNANLLRLDADMEVKV